jgi:hypothetical protein
MHVSFADPSFRVVPGLLHSPPSISEVEHSGNAMVARFANASTLSKDFLGTVLGGPPAQTRGPRTVAATTPSSAASIKVDGSTCGLSKTSGPVGASRLLSVQDDPNCDEFWGADKWRHAAVWFGGTLGIYLFFKTVFKTSKGLAYVLSAVIMSAIGLAREISDANSEKNCFSEQDLFANTVGILGAGLVIAIF